MSAYRIKFRHFRLVIFLSMTVMYDYDAREKLNFVAFMCS
jgi:hypothetical protein